MDFCASRPALAAIILALKGYGLAWGSDDTRLLLPAPLFFKWLELLPLRRLLQTSHGV